MDIRWKNEKILDTADQRVPNIVRTDAHSASAGNSCSSLRFMGQGLRQRRLRRGLGHAIDSNNNIIVTGYTRNGGNYNVSTTKYDSNGNVIWTRI